MEATVEGNPTECALINYLIKSDIDAMKLLQEKNQNKSMFLFATPFDSVRKEASLAYKKKDGGVRLLVKGAPDVVLPKCRYMLKAGGQMGSIDSRKMDAIKGDDEFALLRAACALHGSDWPRALQNGQHWTNMCVHRVFV